MKKVEDRKEIALLVSRDLVWEMRGDRNWTGKAWGDDMPIVRLGGEVGYVDGHGSVFESVEAAFTSSHDGCHCIASLNVLEAVNKIATFITLVALKRRPVEIAKLMFHGEMFMFETFSSSMEQRGLVEHADSETVDGYWPLELTDEGQAGLRMCLESDMVELPFDLAQTNQQLLPEPEPEPEPELLINRPSKRSDEMIEATMKRSIDSAVVFGLKKGLLKRCKDGKIRNADQSLLHNL
jgi:hypothetical protein